MPDDDGDADFCSTSAERVTGGALSALTSCDRVCRPRPDILDDAQRIYASNVAPGDFVIGVQMRTQKRTRLHPPIRCIPGVLQPDVSIMQCSISCIGACSVVHALLERPDPRCNHLICQTPLHPQPGGWH